MVDLVTPRSEKYRWDSGQKLRLKDFRSKHSGSVLLEAWIPYAQQCSVNVQSQWTPTGSYRVNVVNNPK